MAGGKLNELLQQLRSLGNVAPARADPIKLTGQQLDQLRTVVPTRSEPDPAALLTGVPIVVVESTRESTPYLEGWIKCPSCGEPANDHESVACDVTLVFGPFGDFAVRRPPPLSPYSFAPGLLQAGLDLMDDFVRAQRRLLSAPGVSFGDFERVRAGLLALALDDEMGDALARWEDDGGSCR